MKVFDWVLWTLTVCFVALFLVLIGAGVREVMKERCYTNKRVTEVGACDRHGYCGVLFEDGSAMRDVLQPVRGGLYRVEVECAAK